MKTLKMIAAGSALTLLGVAALAGQAFAGNYGSYGGGYGQSYSSEARHDRSDRRQWIDDGKVYWCDFSTGVRRDCELSHDVDRQLGKKSKFDFN